MPKQEHFRIFETKTHQLLLTKDFEDDVPTISFSFFNDGVKVVQTTSYHIEEHRDEVFRDFTRAQAEKMINGILSMFRS